MLLLEPDAPVSAAEAHELLLTVADPIARNARNLEVLSAVHLVRQGVFDPRFRRGTETVPQGWDWTGLPADLDLSRSGTLTGSVRDPAAQRTLLRRESPWSGEPTPYVYATAGSDQTHVWLRGRGDFERAVPHEVFVELTELDEGHRKLPARASFLLAAPDVAGWNVHLPDGLAMRHGRRVWAPTGALSLTDPGVPPRRAFVLSGLREQIRSRWLVRDPQTARAARPGRADVDWSRREIAFPLVGEDHRYFGYISMELDTAEALRAGRTHLYSRLGEARSYYRHRPGRNTGGATLHELPWIKDGTPPPLFGNNHGGAGHAFWHTPSGQVRVVGGSSPHGASRTRRRLPVCRWITHLSC